MSNPRVITGAQTAQRALRILKLLGRHHSSGLTPLEIANATASDRSAVQRALGSLMQEGLVQRTVDSRRYHLGLEAMQLGRATLTRSPLLDNYQFSLQRVARITGDTVFLTIRLGDFIQCAYRDEGATAVRAPRTRTGDIRVMGTTAGGLALLARLDDEEIRMLHGRHKLAFSQAGMDFGTLMNNIAFARRNGYAVLSDNVSEGVTSIGVCLSGESTPFAAVSIAAARSRMNIERIEALRGLLAALPPVPEAGNLQ